MAPKGRDQASKSSSETGTPESNCPPLQGLMRYIVNSCNGVTIAQQSIAMITNHVLRRN